MRSKHRNSKVSDHQTNDCYFVGGNLDTININYKVDEARREVIPKPML